MWVRRQQVAERRRERLLLADKATGQLAVWGEGEGRRGKNHEFHRLWGFVERLRVETVKRFAAMSDIPSL